jgi:hypothetical protein
MLVVLDDNPDAVEEEEAVAESFSRVGLGVLEAVDDAVEQLDGGADPVEEAVGTAVEEGGAEPEGDALPEGVAVAQAALPSLSENLVEEPLSLSVQTLGAAPVQFA